MREKRRKSASPPEVDGFRGATAGNGHNPIVPQFSPTGNTQFVSMPIPGAMPDRQTWEDWKLMTQWEAKHANQN